MPQFFVEPGSLGPLDSETVLRGDEAHHLLRVFRARIGDEVPLFDGEGRRWRATLLEVRGREALLGGLGPLPSNEPAAELCLIQGALKAEGWSLLLTKGTELGATRFLPVQAERSVSTIEPGEAEGKLARWRGLARAAAKQCERGRIPEVVSPLPLGALLAGLGPAGRAERRLALVERSARQGALRLQGVEKLCLAVGPEGGWALPERRALLEAGFEAVSAGPRILRAETAALAALAWAASALGELGDLSLGSS
jgi:16S rRNA (uracil1498-N3)-methyltransferase